MYKFERAENTLICMTFIAVLIFVCGILSRRERERERQLWIVTGAKCKAVINLETANGKIDMCLIQSYYWSDNLNCIVQKGSASQTQNSFLILTIFNLNISFSLLSRV